jgi:hypothetical protein
LIGAGGLLACAAVLAWAPPAQPCGYGMPSPVMRFLNAECVVAGRVIGFEDLNVRALPHAQARADQEYKIAVVHVNEALKGVRGQKHLRVGLYPTQQLQSGQEVVLFLASHFEEPFYVMQQVYEYGISPAGNARALADEVAQYRRLGRMLNDPLTALRSRDPQERLQTAVLLLTHYRTFRPALHHADRRTRAIDPEESRLILEALAEVGWNQGALDFRMNPRRAFALLAPAARDGWNPQGLNGNEVEAAARRWLRDHAPTFRVTALVEKDG